MSKLQLGRLSMELDRRLRQSGAFDKGVTAYALHPGVIPTDLARYVLDGSPW